MDAPDDPDSPPLNIELSNLASFHLTRIKSTETAIAILGRCVLPSLKNLGMTFEITDSFSMVQANQIIAVRFPSIRMIKLRSTTTLGRQHVAGQSLHNLTHIEISPSVVGILPIILSPQELHEFLDQVPQLEILKVTIAERYERPNLSFTPLDILNVCARAGKNLRELEYPLVFTPNIDFPDPNTMIAFKKLVFLEVSGGTIQLNQEDTISDILNSILPTGCSIGASRHTTNYTALWLEVLHLWMVKRDAWMKERIRDA